ncbi:aminotransferase class I/II-fold pyridoxal phosphate-dependent enzyme, partial [Paraburkholderia sp. J67]|uniref:aminotransferase class I/II-fold pyridoxal phosphate-dependent enzyme n=1 Tax=Paraburkholderia sp. J67 TaxID=2805435 RepID=UPI002ABD3F03
MSSDLPVTDLESVPSTNNGENFSLSEFFRTEAPTLKGRVAPFSEYFRESRARGLAHYGREIVSAITNRVQVRGIDGATKEMIMFGSNNYLGLTTHPHVLARIREAMETFGAGVGGPPLLGGTTRLHKELEERLSAWKGSDDTLLYGSGYQANLGWVTTLLRDDDVLLYDEYNHASLYDGIALTAASISLKAIRFAHNDMAHLERLLIRARKSAS